MRPMLGALLVSALVLQTGPVAAQQAVDTQTAIHPDTLPSLSTGTTATAEGVVTTIGGGVRAGDNLFHSFARFSLAEGEIARWTASDSLAIRNVINRVTGGERSFIGGTIDASAMPGADFYFINPAGIIFGDGAFVDVGGTAHFSTAHQLGFADGSVLLSGTASGSTFSMADPARFGFLGNNQPISMVAPASISQGFAQDVAAGRLTLSASDIALTRTNLAASTLALRAVGQGSGSVALSAQPDQGLRAGRIDLDASRIFTADGGQVSLAAGTIRLDASSQIGVTASAAATPAIDIVTDLMDLTSGELRVSGVPGLTDRSGDIRVRAGRLLIGENGATRTESMLEGGGGTILLDADVIHIDGGTVQATGLSAPSRSVGDIRVRAGRLEIVNIGLIGTSLSDSDGLPTGTTGNILIDAGQIFIDSTGLILAENLGQTASGPGSITIRADQMKVARGRISTRTETATPAGPISVTVSGLLELTGIGGIQSISQGLGNAGAIHIRAGTLRMSNTDQGGPTISSETELPRAQEFTRLSEYTGSAGTIVIDAGSIELIGVTAITTSSSSLGNAGDIVISAGRISLSGGAQIASSALRLLVPPSVDEIAADPEMVPTLREMAGPGRAGTVLITAKGLLSMTGGTISTATEGFGAAGEVTVVADRIEMGQGSRISSDAGNLAPGQAGTVVLIARQIALSDGAEVTTSSANVTTAGGVGLVADEAITITGKGSRVSSTNTASGSGGAAGNILVSAPRITLGPGGTITTDSALGAAGQIDLQLPDTGILRLAGGAMPAAIATSSGPGTGGRITISRPYALIADGGRIEALGQQRGANVQLATDFFIRSADNSNLLLVDGDLVVDSQVGNVSSGIDTPDISFGDAAGVLAGQCRAARSSGSVSRLAIDAVGPLALEGSDAVTGGCR